VKLAWIDVRFLGPGARTAVIDAAIHARVEAIVDSDLKTLASLPPTVRPIFAGELPPDGLTGTEIIELREVADAAELSALKDRHRDGVQVAALVNVADDRALRLACDCAITLPYTLVQFKDPTKIPLEIVIAAADASPGQLICEAADLLEARVIVDVLEKGSDGVLLAPQDPDAVFSLVEMLQATSPALPLVELTVNSIRHLGLGDRVCVDTCTQFGEDEGMLIGSYAHGFILCCSETHPLPYMPTRPFRVNAGALHSYVLSQDNRTNYLSELRSGSTVLAVAADGRTRRIVVGRSKLESRPLLEIKASAVDGTEVGLIVQDDWHVRVLGPEAVVLNVTELKPGDLLLGYVATQKRHVGWPVGEFCVES
jgi:3-amino-4-hydroxybenzoic acid synthase